MKLFSLIQLIFTIALLVGVATLGIAHTINGSISFIGIVFDGVIVAILTALIRLSWTEYKEEKNKL